MVLPAGVIVSKPNGISVILTTYNRARMLHDTLTAFQKVAPPGQLPWEILVVDNNSADNTKQIVDSFADKLPLSYHCETELGQSAARNCGIRNCTYEFIIFTDDDVVPCREWLLAYERAYFENPECSIFGGPIDPILPEVAIPKWAIGKDGKLSTLIAAHGQFHGLKPEQMTFFGANMAYHHRNFEEHGMFPTSLGHVGKKKFGGEEVVVQTLMKSAGAKSCFVPNTRMGHVVQEHELKLSHILHRCINSARGSARMRCYMKVECDRNWRRMARALKNSLSAFIQMLSLNPAARFENGVGLIMLWVHEYEIFTFE
jgi:hypothetical protein